MCLMGEVMSIGEVWPGTYVRVWCVCSVCQLYCRCGCHSLRWPCGPMIVCGPMSICQYMHACVGCNCVYMCAWWYVCVIVHARELRAVNLFLNTNCISVCEVEVPRLHLPANKRRFRATFSSECGLTFYPRAPPSRASHTVSRTPICTLIADR